MARDTGGWSWEGLVTTTGGLSASACIVFDDYGAPRPGAVPERDRALRPRGIPFYDVGA
jgi:hypothetical protein